MSDVSDRRSRRNVAAAILPVAGGATWLLIIMYRLRSVNEAWWIARDDAIITLSHAKNAVDHGTIGVSPGGDRVEGFSSPLQFAAAFTVHALRSVDYRTLAMILMAFAIATAGALCVAGFRAVAQDAGWRGGRADVIALAASTAVVVMMAASWTATGWIGSGMENPLMVAAGVGVACGGWLLDRHLRSAVVVLVASLTALGLARVELVALMLPVFAAVTVLVWEKRGGWRWPGTVIAIPVALVGLVHVGRRLYFGAWLPNTAVVQDRSTGLWNVATILLIAAAFSAVLVEHLGRRLVAGPDARRLLTLACRTALLVACMLLIWLSASGRSSGSIDQLALLPALLPLVGIVAVAGLIRRYLGRGQRTSDFVLAGLVLIPVAQYLATGPARLEEFRVAGVVVAFLGLSICSLVIDLAATLRFGDRLLLPPSRHVIAVFIAFALVAFGGVAWMVSNDGPRPLNYQIAWADDLVEAAEAVSERDLAGTGLPIVANPDLGKVSYAKAGLMVDLGLLGDPMMTLVKTQSPDLVTTYLIEVASPDVVNTQRGWSCEYSGWLESDAFAETYVVSEARATVGSEACPENGAFVIWTRRDGGAEYELTRLLLTATEPEVEVARATAECAANGTSPFRCQGVRRSIQRASEELRTRGALEDVVAAMSASPSFELDRPMLLRNAGWGSEAHAAFVRLAAAL